MANEITFDTLMETIQRVAQAERITKEGLRTLSRDILEYMLVDGDIRPVNALLGMDGDGKYILTPINWRIAVQYFAHFLPFKSNYAEVKEYAVQGTGERIPLVFKSKDKKKWDKGVELIREWLDDESNDLWSWSNNAKMDAAPKDWRVELQKVVLNAIGEGKAKQQGEMSLSDVMSAITELEQIGVHDLMAALEGQAVPQANKEHEEIDNMLANGQITEDEAEQMKVAA